MTLDPSKLRDSLSPLFQPPGMPTGPIPDAVLAWAQAYVQYAQAAIAGGTTPAALIAAPAAGADFFTALDLSLRTMWMTAVWAGPGLVGTTSVVPPLQPILLATSAAVLAVQDPQAAVSLIAAALHTYTMSIVVAVTPASGTPVPSPLT